MRGKVIGMHHNAQLAGHPGQYKTLELITRTYWWPGISRDVCEYMEGCQKCQATKSHRTKPAAPLHPIDVPSEPWKVVGTDMIGELPESGGYNVISMFVDHLTKRLHIIPTHTTLTSEGMARIYREHIFPIHGMLQQMIHNQGPQYQSRFIKELYRLLGIEGNFIMAYHLQANEQTEWLNQEIECFLRLFVNYH